MLSFSIGEIAEVADLDETAREHVKQEAVHEFHRVESHGFLFVAVGRVAPAKGDFAVFQTKKPAIGDGYAMSVVSQILDHMLWAGERLLDIGDPLFVLEREGEALKSPWVLKKRQCSGEPQLIFSKGTPQECQKLAAALCCQRLDGEKERRIPTRDPACLIERNTARRH